MFQFKLLRNFLDFGYSFVSFDYRGHGQSSGAFDISTTLSDFFSIAQGIRREVRCPLFGFGSCFGAIPLFHAIHHSPDLFDKVAFVNGITSLWRAIPLWRAVAIHLRHNRGGNLLNLGALAHAVAKEVLPTVESSRDHFGILSFRNVNRWRCIMEYFLPSPAAGLRKRRADVLALCCYACEDDFLRLRTSAAREDYERSFKELFANISFHVFRTNHFFNNDQRKAMITRVVEFFNS